MQEYTGKAERGQAVEKGMEEHDGLVHAFIRRQGGGALSYEEALHAGRIGLWRALLRYDPERGTRFSTYAWVAICRHIRQAGKEEERGEESVEMEDVPSWWEEVDPEEEFERKEVSRAVKELVEGLPERLCQVIRSRYGLEGGEKETLEAIGIRLGVCKERVRQLEEDGLAWLRHPAHSCTLRQLIGKNRAADYRCALAKNAALRRRRGGGG